MEIKRIGVFCGSSVGSKTIYAEKAAELGSLMVESGMELVYGGGRVGLMGVIADEMKLKGGMVRGVITTDLQDKEVGHNGIDELIITNDMSSRKNKINELSDAFIAMPGGFGTMDEVMEVLTYFQLGISEKPVGFLNIDGFFDHLFQFLDRSLNDKFMKYEHRHNIIIESEPEALLKAIKEFKPLEVDEKWIADLKLNKVYQ